MNRRKHFSWLLLVIPSVVMASTAVILLYQEQQRLRENSRQAVQARAQIIVENLDLAVDEMKTSLMDSLENLPTEGLSEALQQWQESSSLVCAAATCSITGSIRTPTNADGTPSFDITVLQQPQGYAWTLQPPVPPPALSNSSPFENSKGIRKDLKEKAAWGAVSSQSAQKAWVYDSEEEPARMAAWVQPHPQEDIRALEVSMPSLLDDLRRTFPDRLEPTEGFALRDPSGQIVHQLASAATPAFRLPIGDELPGWHVLGYHHWQRSWTSRIFWLGSILIGLLTAAILLGARFVWQEAAHESALAAQRTAFVSNVSHELKTPLTSIRMYAELMRDRPAEPAKHERYLNVMVSESQRLTRLVNNVLDFSSLDQKRREFHIAPIDLDAVIQESLQTQRFALNKADFTVTYQPKDPIRVLADRDALERILLNLIDNALKYAKEGKTLTIQTATKDHHAILQVCDRGPGIPPEKAEQIFSRFHRLDNQLTSESGTGLGLSIARMLAQGMNGSLKCRPNDNGHGACFELNLPRAHG